MEYLDNEGNPIEKGFYREVPCDMLSAMRFLKEETPKGWVVEHFSYRLEVREELYSPQKTRNLIKTDPEALIKELEISIADLNFRKNFIKQKLEQLAKSSNHQFGEWGKRPLAFP